MLGNNVKPLFRKGVPFVTFPSFAEARAGVEERKPLEERVIEMIEMIEARAVELESREPPDDAS